MAEPKAGPATLFLVSHKTFHNSKATLLSFNTRPSTLILALSVKLKQRRGVDRR